MPVVAAGTPTTGGAPGAGVGATSVGGPGSLAGGELAVGGCILTELMADLEGPGGLPTWPVPLGDILALLLGLGAVVAGLA